MSCHHANELVPFVQVGQMVHFELVHFLLLGVDLAPLGKVVREEDLTGVSPWSMGILVKEELTQGVRKLSMVSCLVRANLVSDDLWCRKALW